MEVGSTRLRLRLASSVASALESEGLGISPHCAAKPRPGIAAPTVTRSRFNGSSPECWRARNLITHSSGHGTSPSQPPLEDAIITFSTFARNTLTSRVSLAQEMTTHTPQKHSPAAL